ncbi:MAG: hypothetical protein ABJP52_00005, partial [Flavobacteriaceae bacterium]
GRPFRFVKLVSENAIGSKSEAQKSNRIGNGLGTKSTTLNQSIKICEMQRFQHVATSYQYPLFGLYSISAQNDYLKLSR